MRYVAGLDGLRALAILLVLLFHAKVPLLSGGNIGVDLFLVLSGFLISSLLLEELDCSGTVQFRRFYIRRAWRLMPALLLMLALYGIFAPLLWPSYFFHLRDAIAMLLYVANWAAAMGSMPEKLLHGWSLGLEEQFYILWPVFLCWLWKAKNRVPLWGMLLLVYVLLCLWRMWCIYVMGQPIDLAYYRPDMHASGLVLGAALAAWWREQIEVQPISWGWVGWLLVVAAVFAPQSETAHLTLFVPVAELGAALLIISIMNNRQPEFGCRPFVHLGKLSYGLYLFHYPVMLFMAEHPLPWPFIFAVGGGVSYGLAWFSFNTIELAARRYRDRTLTMASARRS